MEFGTWDSLFDFIQGVLCLSVAVVLLRWAARKPTYTLQAGSLGSDAVFVGVAKRATED
jgi:hypothetical protein